MIHFYPGPSSILKNNKTLFRNSFRTVKAVLENVAGRKTKYSSITGSVEVEISWVPLLSSKTPGPGSLPPPFPSSIQGVMSVFVYSANNLAFYTANNGGAAVPTPAGYLPSPQVVCYQF